MTRSINSRRITRFRLRRVLILVVVGVTAGAVSLVGASTASAVLSGSTFEGNDGNLVVNNAANTDWANVAGLTTGPDLASGGNDNAFGQGTKEDVSATNVVDGSIPPNKNDLTRFYEASEQGAGGNIFLYLGWERLVNIGNANLDFEINQNPTTNFTSSTAGPVALNRTAGDLLVTYDFGGSGTPSIGLLKWVTTGSTSQCFSANSLPCWGNKVTLGANVVEAAVNTGPIAESVAGGSLTTGLFGEAAINLTLAGVFQPGVCKAFGSTFVKSRSSSSFTAEIKDFIAPTPVEISNCGTLNITKVTQNGQDSFGYTTSGGLSAGGVTNPSFNLSGGDTKSFTNVNAGTYDVVETITAAQATAGWSLASLSCTSANTNSTFSYAGGDATINMSLGDTVNCTYVNHAKNSPSIATTLSAGSIEVGGTAHDGATLTGASAHAGGSVTYAVYTDSACSQGARAAGTVTVTDGGVPVSNTLTFDTAGDYYWQAVYSGDPDNNGATSTCTEEHFVVNKKSPSQVTAQRLIPDDSFTLSGGSAATGNVVFALYAPSASTCSGSPAFTQTVPVNGDGTYNTTNASSASPFVASAVGIWRWKDVYSGDGNNNGVTSACGTEQFTIANS